MSNEHTYGQRAVGASFNPSGDPNVNELKSLYAQIIDKLNDMRKLPASAEAIRHYYIAITEAQTAQMWAVKAVTWRD